MAKVIGKQGRKKVIVEMSINEYNLINNLLEAVEFEDGENTFVFEKPAGKEVFVQSK